MEGEFEHKPFCLAGQAAPCSGYFPNDVLPCICGLEGDVVTALTNVTLAFNAFQAGAGTPGKNSGRTSSRRPDARRPRIANSGKNTIPRKPERKSVAP